VHLGGLVDDLVVADADQVDEREVDDRAQAGHRRADASADEPHLGDRGIDDALGAELGDQAAAAGGEPALGLGLLAAGPAGDVLADHDDRRVAPHLLSDRFEDRLREGQLAGDRGHLLSPQRAGT
jgi:hypothetical protein